MRLSRKHEITASAALIRAGMRRTADLAVTAAAVMAVAFVGALPQAIARELTEFYRGVRAMGMGNAYTAVADDADALFYNPAGLALNSSYEFRLMNPKIDISTDDILLVGNIRSAVNKLDATAISAFFGKHIYADLTAVPGLYFPGLALGYYYDVHTHLISRNLVIPSIEASYIRDRGLIGGFSHEFHGFGSHHFLRLGASLKWITRSGFDRTFSLSELVALDSGTISGLIDNSATGWGLGLGMQYDIPISRRDSLTLGSAWQDVGDTQFGSSSQANRPPSIRNNLSAGLEFVHRFSANMHAANNVKVAAELRHLSEANLDPRRRLHLGAELQLGSISLQAGLNQDSLTGGAKLDMFFIEIAAVTYGVETQSLAFMDRERRYMVQLTFKLDVMGKSHFSERDEDRRKHPRSY